MLRTNDFYASARNAGFGLRLSVFYMAIFFIVGCYMPFLPVWLRWRGLTDAQISLIYSAPVIVRAVFTPIMTFLADRAGRPVTFLKWLSWGVLLSVLLLPLTNGFPSIFSVVMLYTLFWMSVIPLTDAVALAGARVGRADYGRMRLWGSFSYIAMNLAGGAAVERWGSAAPVWLFIIAATSVLIAVYWLPTDEAIAATDAAGLPLQKLRPAEITQLVRAPLLWLFLAATSATQAAHAVYYIFGTLHWTAAGISPLIIGMLWGTGVVAEVVLFAYGQRVSKRFGPVQLIAIAGGAAVVRWTVTAYDPPLPILFLAQTLHGLTFGAAHLGAMQFMNRAIPQRLAASAQGLYASVASGVVMGGVSFASGYLYRTLAGEAFLIMALLGFAGLILSLALLRQWDGGLILSPKDQVTAAE